MHSDLYSGGSLLTDLLKAQASPVQNAVITAAVRSADQAAKVAKLGINVIQLDITNAKAVNEAVIGNES